MGESLHLSVRYFQLLFKNPFGIAHGTRNSTEAIYVKASFMGIEGYGEAAVPPYLGYDVPALVENFYLHFPAEMKGSDAIRSTIAKLAAGNSTIPKPLKTAVDIAMYDLYARLTQQTVRNIFGIQDTEKVKCSFTLGISSVDELVQKLNETTDFSLFKIKLGGENDKERIEAFLNNSSSPFCVDANQAWNSVTESLEWMHWLKERNCLFVEQPLPVKLESEYSRLYQASPLPIILDESIQGISDLERLSSVCHGINVKLLKCGGIEPAQSLVRQANKLGLKVLVGCMSESTCGAMAAAQLSPWADWVDLDGPRLISNDPFTGAVYDKGSLLLSPLPGIGAELKDKNFFNP
ncbi:MAG: dipeptide epimerase [Bacteroidia bacterium]|jgi:L-alanine-DL-glutamate epimerase-like enolase superfamily enzyme|nr:dipeptide epimerase [Bacteroidota bacterium]MBP7244590.1 dipeptide epimerase [Bacteroidia bacterium]